VATFTLLKHRVLLKEKQKKMFAAAMKDFQQQHNASAEIIKTRQKEIAPKDGQMSMVATLDAYIGKTGSGEETHNVNRSTPPPTEMKTSRDGKKKWEAPIPMYVKLDSMSEVPDMMQREVDPVTGAVSYTVAIEVKFFDTAKKYLEEKASFVWTHDDPYSQKVREFVSAEGVLTSRIVRTYTAGDVIKASAPDRKGNVFREKVDPKSSIFRVQPGAPLRMYNVQPVAWVSLSTEEIKEDDTAHGDDVENVEAAEGEPKTRKEKRIRAYIKFECKGQVQLGEDYDPMLTRSERMHALNKDVHNLLPVEQLRADMSLIHKTPYFYVDTFYMTPGFDPTTAGPTFKGVSVQRETVHNVENFLREAEGQTHPWIKLSFDVFQWTGADHKAYDQYNVQVVDTDKGDVNWRQFGITNVDAYADIMAANLDLPMHLNLLLWGSSTINNPANDPQKLNDKPELKQMRGYYTYGVKNVLPDFLRYFRERGLRLSPERVKHEFRGSAVMNNRGQTKIQMLPRDRTKQNPVNTGGIQGAVLALGNGIMEVSLEDGEEHGINHAWEGNLMTLLEGDQHDFYVLVSVPMGEEERKPWLGRDADEYLDLCIDQFSASYWIYAVRRDAKMAPNYVSPQGISAQEVEEEVEEEDEEQAKRPKRERVEDEDEYLGSEYSETEGGTRRRSTRVRQKQSAPEEMEDSE